MNNKDQNAYQKSVEQVLEEQHTTLNGLSHNEVQKRIEIYGPNSLSEKKSTSPIKIFINQFTNPLVILLLASSIISIFLSEFIDAGFIFFIVLTNAAVGFVQEYKAENTIQALKKLLSPKSYVTRDGKQIEIESRELVPGDIVHITAGNAIPADLRLFDVQNLRIDESALTGESVPVEKNEHLITDIVQVADQHNMAFMGTIAVGGKASGIVTHTGNSTFLGTIAQETSEAKVEQSPLIKKFARFAKTIGIIVIVSSILIASIQVAKGESITSILKVVVGIAVAAIPEGLPIIATIALSIGVQRMGKKKAIIRHLPAAETLGSTTVICTDKTGTLTRNQMDVMKIFDGEKDYDPTISYKSADDKMVNLLRCGAFCTEIPDVLHDDGAGLQADPTEIAVVNASKHTGISADEIEKVRYLDVMPFQNETRIMATLIEREGEKILYVKGSPEKIFEISGIDRNSDAMSKVEEYARNGLRVIACAEKKIPSENSISETQLASGFTFLGLFALIDPPRADVKDAISHCKKSGIRVVMITGDHPTTATAIANQLGIAGEGDITLTGQDLFAMSDQKLNEVIRDCRVFARVTPDQKLRIVKAFKEAGEIVAVTGDGVNDAPALRSAHIGVAMGLRGTDVAKEAAHMVILDDNFSTIVKAVKEARVLFSNIRKATFFLIPPGFSVILTVFVSVLLGYPMPFTAVQLLWLNMVTNGLQDISLAFEPEENDILSKPPRKTSEGIMSPLLYRRSIFVAVIITIGVLIMYISAVNAGVNTDQARTIALSTMIIFQFFQLFNSRSETQSIFKQNPFGNKVLIIAMIIALIAFALTLTFSPLQFILETTSIAPSLLVQILLMAFSVIVVVEIDKALTRKIQKA